MINKKKSIQLKELSTPLVCNPIELKEAKRHICEVCGRGFKITKEKHYISKTKKENSFLSDLQFFDAFDCPYCGSQYLAKIRVQSVSNEVSASQNH